MGSFHIAIGVGNPVGGDFVSVPKALVDPGAAHTMLPESLLSYIHLAPRERFTWSFADGSSKELRELGYGMARISIDDRDWHCPVIFGPEDEYLVGATTLEIFGLMVGPVSQQLVARTYQGRSI